MPNGGGPTTVLQRLGDRKRPAMKRQRLIFAAAAAVLAMVAAASMQITTSSTAYCAPKDNEAKRVAPQTSQSKKSFKEDVLPVFVGRCVSCHQSGGEGYVKTGLDLTSYAGVMKGTKFGPMVIPGDPESSNLMLLLD